MKKLIAGIMGMALAMGFAPVSYAVKEKAHVEKQDEALQVKNPKGENIGTIRGALEDPSGNIAFVVVSINDVNKGKREVIVPVTAFSQGDEKVTFILDLNKETLAAAPDFNPADLNDPAYAERIYRFYGQAPPWEKH